MSPPRQKKPVPADSGRKFSWATERIAELTAELQAAQGKIKVRISLFGLLHSLLHVSTHVDDL